MSKIDKSTHMKHLLMKYLPNRIVDLVSDVFVEIHVVIRNGLPTKIGKRPDSAQ